MLLFAWFWFHNNFAFRLIHVLFMCNITFAFTFNFKPNISYINAFAQQYIIQSFSICVASTLVPYHIPIECIQQNILSNKKINANGKFITLPGIKIVDQTESTLFHLNNLLFLSLFYHLWCFHRQKKFHGQRLIGETYKI